MSIHNIVSYIAGFVIMKLKYLIKCDICRQALIAINHNSNKYNLLKIKSKGGLTFPSDDVIEICLTSERVFTTTMAQLSLSSQTKLTSITLRKMTSQVMEWFIGKPIFESLSEHGIDSVSFEFHSNSLLKAISEKYLQIRFYYKIKIINKEIMKKIPVKSSRQMLNKLTICSGQ